LDLSESLTEKVQQLKSYLSKEISNRSALLILLDSRGYYALLGVSEQATYHEIKRAYRRLARKYHPDRNNSSHAESMIKKINAAFEILSDQEKRFQYDKNHISIEFHEEELQHDLQEKVSRAYRSHPNSKSINNDISADGGRNDPRSAHLESVSSNLLDVPKGRFQISVEPSLCLAFGSCETLAPSVFVLEQNKRINPKVRIESETAESFESILAAAQTCPTKAIKIVDRYTGEQIYP
jgi:ferredoxin